VRVLYLFSRYYHDRKTSFGRRHYGYALSNVDGVDLRIWGPGWEGYDEELSVSENLEQNWRLEWVPQIVWVYKPEDYRGVPSSARHRLVIFNETHDAGKTREEIDGADATLVVFHHVRDYLKWAGSLEAEGRWCLHLPHAADPGLFRNRTAWAEKRTGLLVTGTLSEEFYPLRHRLADLVRRGRVPGEIRERPPYRMRSLEENEAQAEDYAAALDRWKLTAVCASKFGYGLQKYPEAALSGTVMVGDVPPEYAGTLGQGVIKVGLGMSESQLVEPIMRALADDTGTLRLSYEARVGAQRSHTLQRYAERLADWLRISTF